MSRPGHPTSTVAIGWQGSTAWVGQQRHLDNVMLLAGCANAPRVGGGLCCIRRRHRVLDHAVCLGPGRAAAAFVRLLIPSSFVEAPISLCA